jgi:tRNA(Ile)-lysidine synthetase-like protein
LRGVFSAKNALFMTREFAFEDRICIPSGARFLAAVSGGADSTAGLCALEAIRSRKNKPFDLRAVHVNHGLRGEESEEDEKFVRSLCDKLSVPLFVAKIAEGKLRDDSARMGLGIEAAAREARHKEFRVCAEKNAADWIFVFHTKDDAIETSVMRFLRGSSSRGLAAMPAQNGKIFRPILGLSRSDVIQYLKQKNTSWRTDSSNNSCEYTRNRIRLKVIPLLNDLFPGWQTAVSMLSETQSYTASCLENIARKYIHPLDENNISIYNFDALDLILKEDAIFLSVDMLSKERPLKLRDESFLPEDFLESRADPVCEKRRPVKRAAIRNWIKSGLKTADLGEFTVTRDMKGGAVLRRKNEEIHDGGYSIVLNSSGKKVVFNFSL